MHLVLSEQQFNIPSNQLIRWESCYAEPNDLMESTIKSVYP